MGFDSFFLFFSLVSCGLGSNVCKVCRGNIVILASECIVHTGICMDDNTQMTSDFVRIYSTNRSFCLIFLHRNYVFSIIYFLEIIVVNLEVGIAFLHAPQLFFLPLFRLCPLDFFFAFCNLFRILFLVLCLQQIFPRIAFIYVN